MAVRRSLYLDWRRHPVTQELMKELAQVTEGLVASMINREIPDLHKDQFCRAFVRCADEVISWQPTEFLPEEEEEDGN